MRRNNGRTPVAEGELERTWEPERKTNEEFAWWVLGTIAEGPRTSGELFDLASRLPEVEELAPGTIRARISASLLWLRRDGLAEAYRRDGRCFVWSITQDSLGG